LVLLNLSFKRKPPTIHIKHSLRFICTWLQLAWSSWVGSPLFPREVVWSGVHILFKQIIAHDAYPIVDAPYWKATLSFTFLELDVSLAPAVKLFLLLCAVVVFIEFMRIQTRTGKYKLCIIVRLTHSRPQTEWCACEIHPKCHADKRARNFSIVQGASQVISPFVQCKNPAAAQLNRRSRTHRG
jgi:hypothetical protein